MAREFYEGIRFRGKSFELLAVVAAIVERYQKLGLRLTLRQVYYQVVVLGREDFPNSERSYKRLGKILSDARLSGYIDWTAIEDRARAPKQSSEFQDVSHLMDAAIWSYRLPRMEGQKNYVELWCEKDALASVLLPIAQKHHITLMVNRGYSSQSAMHESAVRLDAACRDRRSGEPLKKPVILYLGDLDPSGEDMVRDVDERLNKFLRGFLNMEEARKRKDRGEDAVEDSLYSPAGFKEKLWGTISVRVEKLALTMDQVEEFDPPPNPAKLSDSRATKFVEKHGDESWEVDALPPEALTTIIEDRLEGLIDQSLVDAIIETEETHKRMIRRMAADIDTGRYEEE